MEGRHFGTSLELFEALKLDDAECIRQMQSSLPTVRVVAHDDVLPTALIVESEQRGKPLRATALPAQVCDKNE